MFLKNNKSPIFFSALSLIVPLLLIFTYNYLGHTFKIGGITLKKFLMEEGLIANEKKKPSDVKKTYLVKIIEEKKQKLKEDSLKIVAQKDSANLFVDTSKFEQFISQNSEERVLIMGDSECGGLCKQLNDYCIQNGHKLVASFVWNSATILNFAYADTVTQIIKKYKPTYIFLVVGLNELYAKDIAKRKKAAMALAKKLEGIRYSWIGPANYVKDYGINNAFFTSALPGTFFSSKDLNLPKGSDNRHPNTEGYRMWMDTIASWVSTSAKYPLQMNEPLKRKQGIKSKIISLNASKYRGY
jgi:hypothetical protein